MRYEVAADAEGTIYIGEAVTVEHDDLWFDFTADENGYLKEIVVGKTVPESMVDEFQSTIDPQSGPVKARISIGGNRDLHDTLIDSLQMIESHLAWATNAALQRIRWDAPRQQFVPESADEEQLLSILSVSHKREYPPLLAEIAPDLLETIVQSAPLYDELRVPMSFWREGQVYFARFRYIEAFYQFYFVIEDFYASGRSSKASVLRAFERSSEFGSLCDLALDKFQAMPRHGESLKELFDVFQCEVTRKGLQDLLFAVRGALHHYSSGSPRPKGTPFNQQFFETIALVTAYLSTTAIGYRIVQIGQSLESQ
jgi:hypothetical protein